MKGDRWANSIEELRVPEEQFIIVYRYYSSYHMKPFMNLGLLKAFVTRMTNEANRTGNNFEVIDKRNYQYSGSFK